jgi:carboxyl-terminal processing protease
LQEAKTLTGLFIDRGPTVQIRSKANRVDVLSDRDVRTAYRGPLAVLVNRLSASASEIFAGAIQDYQRGVVIGTQTFGKGTVQTLQPLDHGQLKMTQAKFYRITGDSTQHRGIIPDLQYPDDYDPEAIGESTLDAPLPWDQIRPTFYRTKGDLQPLLPELISRHQARMAKDPEFNYVSSAFAYRQSRADDTQLSLREADRIKEREENETFWLSLMNNKREAQGLSPLASLDELDEDAESIEQGADPDSSAVTEDIGAFVRDGGAAKAITIDLEENAVQTRSEDQADGTQAEEPPKKKTPDAYVIEAGHILADLISIQQRTAQQGPARAPI